MNDDIIKRRYWEAIALHPTLSAAHAPHKLESEITVSRVYWPDTNREERTYLMQTGFGPITNKKNTHVHFHFRPSFAPALMITDFFLGEPFRTQDIAESLLKVVETTADSLGCNGRTFGRNEEDPLFWTHKGYTPYNSPALQNLYFVRTPFSRQAFA